MPRGGSHFGDRLAALVEERRSRVVLGLDPDPAALWPAAVAAAQGAGDRAVLTGGAVARHCMLAIDAVASSCVAVKLQLACFERLGEQGWRALRHTIAHAKERGLLVIADGKPGALPVPPPPSPPALFGGPPRPPGPR